MIRFFQSFDNSNCVFNFYPFDLDSAYNNIIQYPPSILIVDFDHPVLKKSGLKPFEEIISYLSHFPILIGISSTKSYAYEALKAGFNDYLITPLKELEIRKSLLKFQNKIQLERKDCEMICLKSYSDYRFLKVDEILFLKADNNTTDIFLKKEKEVTAFKSLGYFERKLPKCFFRIHNSYIINATAVRRINYNKALLFFEDGVNSFSVPFSRTYKKNVDNLKDILGKSDISLSS
ncbi:DNA-binding LytR/AlgR family response regulator [Leeuwenhoekiella aestuarii]|uniref:DNA-binding LytR/AlgR family response regulator n=1 Tax=Leeuwenhoekiella aestuarii TaxID=2249426 RepID=A0A4Q0NT18_9FLAO|nr:LytTR family DNA-binding domain-containing protein [Leeuwenhoekiella aestuarii]RXG14239.1 DNA-binding LytR/AlgR family response regulator [Leeuwenhoekiella aestuarii]RXG18988.1 DNA-binding LytR/AlgR family response regulator [Leeuwenhoekiella aestuarii]